MTATTDKQPPVALSRYEFERLATIIEKTNDSLVSLGGRTRQHSNWFEEIQQTLDLHSGRYDRLEDNLRRQDKVLETILDLLRRAQPADTK